jgi:O-antigen ligase
MSRIMPYQKGEPIRRRLKLPWIPPRSIEYAYYFTFSYSTVAAYLNVEIPLVAAALLTCLAGFCVVKMGSSRREIYAPIALLLACQITYLLVQVAVHDVALLSDSLRWFILWIFGMIVAQSLCLRPGFLLRCTIVLFAIGLIAVPHLGYMTDVVERARADIDIGGGLQNANGLAAWFGFCVVLFGVAAIDTKRRVVIRILYGIAATVSVIVVGLTVSRGSLLGCAIALAVGCRHLLKRGFVPVLLLIVFAGILFMSGWFDQIVSGYEARATEETGRFLLWPYVVERFSTSPFVGVGVSNIDTYIPEVGHSIATPHNSFLFFALSSGIVPFALYLAFWVRAAWGSFFGMGRSEYSPFRAPLFLYALVSFFLADVSAEPWSVLALVVASGPLLSFRSERFPVNYRNRNPRLAGRLQYTLGSKR